MENKTGGNAILSGVGPDGNAMNAFRSNIPGPDREITGDDAFWLAKAAGIPTTGKPGNKPGQIVLTTAYPVAVWVKGGRIVVFTFQN